MTRDDIIAEIRLLRSETETKINSMVEAYLDEHCVGWPDIKRHAARLSIEVATWSDAKKRSCYYQGP